MKAFKTSEIDEALDYSRAGGQALHLHRIIVDYNKAPKVFIAAVRRGENIAHLFDSDYDRLEKTARRLGVRVIVVEREGTDRQHIDLCGKPLQRALALCGEG
jgi:hypothetical protein